MKAYIKLNSDETFFTQFFEEGKQPLGFIEKTYSDNFLVPKYNPNTDKFYEGATVDEFKKLVPKEVTSRQLRTQLFLSGLSLDSINSAIDTLADPDKTIAKVNWEYAVTFERDNELLKSIAIILGLGEQEVDEIFINAVNL